MLCWDSDKIRSFSAFRCIWGSHYKGGDINISVLRHPWTWCTRRLDSGFPKYFEIDIFGRTFSDFPAGRREIFGKLDSSTLRKIVFPTSFSIFFVSDGWRKTRQSISRQLNPSAFGIFRHVGETRALHQLIFINNLLMRFDFISYFSYLYRLPNRHRRLDPA